MSGWSVGSNKAQGAVTYFAYWTYNHPGWISESTYKARTEVRQWWRDDENKLNFPNPARHYMNLAATELVWKLDKEGQPKISFGNFYLERNLIQSYNMVIGKVDRDHRIILWNRKAEKYSLTTSRHLGHLLNSCFVNSEWFVYPVDGLQHETSVFEDLKRSSIRREDIPDLHAFTRTLQPFWPVSTRSLSKACHHGLKTFIAASPDQRKAILGIYELANDLER